LDDSLEIQSIRQRLKADVSVSASQGSSEPIAAVAIVINPGRDNGSVLLIRRRDREGDPWSGQVAFPGGHKSPNDQTLLHTAIRETAEEVGIQLKEDLMLGALPPVCSLSRRVLVAPFVFQLEREVSVQLNEEVAEAFWAPLRELSKIEPSPSLVMGQQGSLQVDSYICEGHVIWGLTFRIINMLLGRS
jgi:8-oxo-dGTP pyrophosphatase MutT (NUDIX family)